MRLNVHKRWLTAGIIGVILFGSIPSKWGVVEVYATADIASVSSSQQIRSKIAEGMAMRQTSLSFKYKGSTKNLENMLKDAMNGALDSDPYTKYIVDRYAYSWRGTTGAAKITINIVYRETAEQSAYVNERVQAILKEIIKPSMNDHQRVKAVHDYVVINLKYDEDLKIYTAYEGLRTGEAVCQGYALLTYKLLQGAGIENLIIEGNAGGQAHAWNLVLLDKKWYHIDTTWDDPIQDSLSGIRYSYYLKNDEEMRRDHIWTKKYPSATSSYKENLQSLIKKGGKVTAFYQAMEEELGYNLYDAAAVVTNSAGLQSKVKQGLKKNKLTVTLRYSGLEKSLLEDLGSLYELNIKNISYLTEPLEGTEDWRVEIHWEMK
ncbi:transglutaminase-like putative cysteine protease [Paenibacillus anaericanus]|uniref:transglutaminase domain-containing protein n=1 Tax=Paenibacillus anaericanus TaxID=170367 RepID=UPI0027825EE4|nr:transglutaminase domain-containing protein [Paenibacillus anaericanus]MDQ0091289.1 transglutaminase-like putative cysteine protease [Paenibacillus anaericanus]